MTLITLERKVPAQQSTQGSTTFDRIYSNVTSEQSARLKQFRLSHPYKALIINSTACAGKLFPALPRRLFVPLLKLRLHKMLISKLRTANHPEAEFWSAYLNEAIASDLLKEVFIHQNKCLLELAHQPPFTSTDLTGWNGKILIIESDDDPAISRTERARLRSTYPQAHVHTFKDAGHAASILRRDEVVALIEGFCS